MRAFNLHLHIDRQRRLTTIDKAMSVAAVVQPLMTLPQVWQIYTTQNATSLSLITWISYLLLGFIFLAYAIVHNIKPLIVTQILWVIMDLLVIVGILIYR